MEILKHPPSIKESIAITFIKIGAVVSEISRYIVKNSFHIYIYTQIICKHCKLY